MHMDVSRDPGASGLADIKSEIPAVGTIYMA